MMDYDVTLIANLEETLSLKLKVAIPVTSLCPCSKKSLNMVLTISVQ